MRLKLEVIIFMMLFGCIIYAQSPIDHADRQYEFPVTTDFGPDSNFAVLGYGLPNNPRTESIYGDHLYLGCGPFLKIYRLGGDGKPTFTGQVRTHDIIWDMEHDGEYLYVSNGVHGLTIYEGNNFYEPAELSNTTAPYCFWKICLKGDSLLFIAHDRFLGILNIADVRAPYIERIIDDDSIVIPGSDYQDIFIYDHYLIADIVWRNPYPKDYLAIYDLSIDSLPGLVDTAYFPSYNAPRSLKAYENRIYQQNLENIQLFELVDGSLQLQNIIDFTEGREFPIPFGLTEAEINGTDAVLLGIRAYYQYTDSTYAIIQAFDIENFANPVFIDSTSRAPRLKYWNLIQRGNFTYGLGDHEQCSGYLPGLFVYEWDNDFNSELIGHYTEYSYCRGVVVGDGFAYARTQDDRMFLLDISDKTNPEVIDEMFTLPLRQAQMEIHGDTLYILTSYSFKIFDITDPLYPQQIGMTNLPTGYNGINFQFCLNYVLICYCIALPNGDGGFMAVNLSDPTHPEIVSDRPGVSDGPKPMKLDYPLLFLPSASPQWRIAIYDVTDPSHPYRRRSIDDLIYNPMSVCSWQHYLYTFGAFEEIYDVTGSGAPELLNSVNNLFGEESDVYDDKIFLSDWRAGVKVWDLAQSPFYRQITAQYGCFVWGDIVVELPYVYIPSRELGLIILKLEAPTSIDDQYVEIPGNMDLLTAYPNPFNSTVNFNVQQLSVIGGSLTIYDILGKLVKTIDLQTTAHIQWDGRNNCGEEVGSGVYFGKYSNGMNIETVKVVLVR